MSRWHDISAHGIATWANLPIEERLADRLADLMLAADEIADMLQHGQNAAVPPIHAQIARIYEEASAVMVLLPQPGLGPSRDPEVADVLDRISAVLAEAGAVQDEAYARAEAICAPYGLALYFEIIRLDALLGTVGGTRRASVAAAE
jgi:hypothetical protein